MAGPGQNVRLCFEDVNRALCGNVPSPFRDLLDIAVYVYVADQAFRRGSLTDRHFGADWRRRLCFHIPVRDPDLWKETEVMQLLVSALSFLTEDEYGFQFERLVSGVPIQNYFRFIDGDGARRVEEVVLYSGGLDSTAGAVQEAVLDRRRVMLVQHRPSPKPTPRQRALIRRLRAKVGASAPDLATVRVNKKKSLTRETTQQSRSFLFTALGAALACTLDLPRVRFYENGVTSLNLPPSPQVVGARASRTTHPKVLEALSRLLTHLAGRRFTVENRFQWQTKTDVVRHIAAADCADLIRLTTSCVCHRRSRNERPHCGQCSQCIDRRFAVLAAGQESADPAEDYRLDLLTGAQADGHPRTMLAVYVEMARQIAQMQSVQFFGRYGEAGRVLRHVDGAPEEVAQRVFKLYQRHSREVMKVVEDGIALHAAAIARRSLPPSCLVRLV
jgi:7-cyano-7-deazaguanine synthase in queuosine biosynthesis